MLELKQITKIYPAGGENVQALKGIDMQFRKSEFVSVLGPSGCGKTTLLNIIGGLDQYTSGDLQINGRSTKDFKDRDWDTYRNHSIGFVFQSYNLIPHQTVLQNVELALTLSGVKKSERRKRAKEALIRVGLKDQMKKKPAEMSGGQMQRVAIARAIVNNPDIILADEPTGALDTETSKQVMDILKEIAKDRLVIMVTHNPDLANEYSTRIIRMLDGLVTDDSAPLTAEEIAAEQAAQAEKTEPKGRKKMPSMSFGTSFGLSLKNLFTKKGRTALTSFAGSIGIIGIALIYAVSQGTTNYIDAVQEDTLASYPLTLEAKHVDIGTLLETFVGKAESMKTHEKDAVYPKAMVHELMNSINTMEEKENDLASFKKYIEKECKNKDSESGLYEAVSGVQYTYDLDLLVYTENVDGNIIRSDSQELLSDLISEYFGMDMQGLISARDTMSMGSSASMMDSASRLWQEMLCGQNGSLISPLLKKQYDVVYGEWPTKYNEVVLVLDENNELDDMALYALGLESEEYIDEMMESTLNKEEIQYKDSKWSYKDICSRDYRVILNSDCYSLDETTGLYTDLRDTKTGLRYLYDNGMTLKISGIIRPNEDAVSTMITGAIAYTKALTEEIISRAEKAPSIKAQKEDPTKDVFTGLLFEDSEKTKTVSDKAAAFKDYVDRADKKEKAEIYKKMMSTPSKEVVDQTVESTLAAMSRQEMEAMMLQNLGAQMKMDSAAIETYIANMSDEEIKDLFASAIEEQVKESYAAEAESKLAFLSEEQLLAGLKQLLPTCSDEDLAHYYEETITFSDSNYEDNLLKLGAVDLDSPSSINLYASTFSAKDVIEDAIADYNETVEEMSQIEYTDYIGILLSSVTTIIDAITYVLIAFVSVSLIVSSIMIGVITLISVQERTKEIGILRAIGASKRNVSSMFNAETVIIGFTSGLLGVLITYLLCIPINLILHSLTGINNLSAVLPVPVAVTLVIISMLLTLIAGIIPSRSAAKKDPVVALRTE